MLTYISCLSAFIAFSNAAVIIQQDYDGKQVCCLALKHTHGIVEEEYTRTVPRYSRKVTEVPCTRDELSWWEKLRDVKKICSKSTTTTVKYETIKASRTVSRIVHTTCPQDVKVCCHDYVAHQGACKPSNEVLGQALGIIHGATKDILGDNNQGVDWKDEVSKFIDPQG